MKLIRHTFNTEFEIREIEENGMTNDDRRSNYKGFAAVIRDKKGRILIQKHNKYDMYTIPCGKCSKGKSVQDEIARELEEECGIYLEAFRKLDEGKLYFKLSDGNRITIHLYLVEVLQYSGTVKNLEPHKHEFQKFVKIDKIREYDFLSYATQLFLDHYA